MNIVFFSHPDFLGHQSMPRFTKMLAEGMKERGHKVEVWKPEPKYFNLSNNKLLTKWLGYIDQFVVFPVQIKSKIKVLSADTIFVITDQALGPWVPLINNRAHVIHCHDFLAQFSALGLLEGNRTSFTGKLYQNFIWQGYSKAKNFISVSKKTNDDLLKLLKSKPNLSEIVYNGLNQSFIPSDINKARELLSEEIGVLLIDGFILHIGGNQWYKNRSGVIEIYNTWRNISHQKLPLLLIGENPSFELEHKREISKYKEDIFFLSDITDKQVQMAYNGASVLIFPSLAEGFGWPIAEAMASGCPVITTNVMPMIEVAGDAAFLIPLMPKKDSEITVWATEASKQIEYILNLSLKERNAVIEAGIENAKRFETKAALDAIEKIYLKILNN